MVWLLVTAPVWAGAQALVTRALARDRTLADLERAVQAAEWQLRRQNLLVSQPRLEVRTGEISVSEAGGAAAPEVAGTVPVLGAEALVKGTLTESAALAAARDAVADRKIEVERQLIEGLRTLARAQITLARAERALIGATRDRDKGRTVDGAQARGASDLSKDRSVRAAARDKRIADQDVRKALEVLQVTSGYTEGELFDPPPVSPILGPSDRALTVLRARRLVQEAEARAAAPGPTVSLFWSLGTGWSSADQDNAGFTPQTRAGVRVEADEWKAEAGVSAAGNASGISPAANLSLTWSPSAAGVKDLEDQGRRLAVDGALDAERAARDQAERARKDLEVRGNDLRIDETEADQDVADAERQLTLALSWLSQGVVAGTDVDEARASLAEARATASLARLDWLLWDLDRRALFGPEDSHEN